MIRGTIKITPNRQFRLEVPALGLQLQTPTLHDAVAEANAWLRDAAGPEPAARVEVTTSNLLDGRAFGLNVLSQWDDPALLEAIRVRRGDRP